MKKISKENELISIVVPVYNVENYLDRCIESLINQSYDTVEIILVNDGSTDKSKEICERYAMIDNRIKLINKVNGGLSDARNYGIRECKGNYIFFIDSDDYMHKDTINYLYKNLKDNNADISTVLYKKTNDKENIIDENKTNSKLYICNNKEALEMLLYQDNCTTSAWGKLYKKNLFKDIEYPVGKVHEDLPVTYKLFFKSKKIIISNAQMYYYVLRETSITGSNYNIKRAVSLEFANEETKFVKKNIPVLIQAAINREFMEGIFTILGIGMSKQFKEIKKQAFSIVKKYRITVIKDKHASKKSKLFALISFLGSNMIVLTCDLYKNLKRNG